MKNIILGSFFTLVLLPQFSFAATQTTVPTKPPVITAPVVTAPAAFVDPALTAFNDQQNADSVAFFQKQGHDRGVFMKANPDVIAKEELRFKRARMMGEAQREGKPTSSMTPPGDKDATFAAFEAGQLAEKQAFFAKQGAARQAFLAAHPGDQ